MCLRFKCTYVCKCSFILEVILYLNWHLPLFSLSVRSRVSIYKLIQAFFVIICMFSNIKSKKCPQMVKTVFIPWILLLSNCLKLLLELSSRVTSLRRKQKATATLWFSVIFLFSQEFGAYEKQTEAVRVASSNCYIINDICCLVCCE